mgnify:FL=1|jgi:hypothetical protein
MEQTGPSYYRRGSIEPWDFIRDQGLNYHLGNALKYICRAGHKDSKEEDLKKAIHYLENELNHHVLIEQPSYRVPPCIPYTERFEFTYDAEEFDR